MDHTALWITALTSILTCGGTSTIIVYFLKRHDRFKDVSKTTARQAEGINVLALAMLDLTNALHAKGIINGESEKVREELSEYLYKCTAEGFRLHEQD